MVKKSNLLGIPILLTVFLLLAIVKSLSLAAPIPPQPTPPVFQAAEFQVTRLHPALVKILSSRTGNQQIPIIIEWGSQTYDQVLNAALSTQNRKDDSRLQERSLVVSALQTYAMEQSRALRSTLQAAEKVGQASDVRTFWVSPVIAAKASPELIEALSYREDIVQIRPDERIYLEQTSFVEQGLADGMPWNLELIGVSLAQQQLGLDGSGVVVANLDTGVDWQHPALIKKYRGYNPHGPAQHLGNWFVATDEPYLVPGDGNGHGTHTMGTMVGDDEAGNRTGVAPGARWIAVKLFNNQGYTYESWIHAAFQWIMAPEGNSALAPDIVNCSWGSEAGGDDRYRADVTALRSAGILPVFSAGNTGPSQYTVNSPASYPEAISVGAVDQDKFIALFSSRGPSPWNEIKPEFTAPGIQIRSTFPGNGYATASGTSMAAPHVAGLAALLLQSNPLLTPDEIEQILRETAQPLGAVIPNNDYGSGLVQAYAAGLKVTAHGELTGMVIRAGGSSPVPYPLLSATSLENPVQTLTAAGDANGTYRMALHPGHYDLSISAFGFLPATLHNLEIITGTQTRADVILTPEPTGILAGKVTDLQDGLPLSATLKVEGTPMSVQSNPTTGIYQLSLPEGTWKINVFSPLHRTGHITPTITAGSSYTYNVSLLSAPNILLVDGGRWYNGSQISFFRDALDALDYPYHELPIRSIGLGGTPDERPARNAFNAYDVVIWSDPLSSPGWIEVNDVITDFLKSDGHLLVSGEDILYLDGGGSFWSYPASYMIKYIGLQFKGEGNLSPLNGVRGSFLDGLQIFLNTPDSSQQQALPDEAKIRSPLMAHAVLGWSDQGIGGVAAGICQPYRAFWTGFGFEGAGPRTQRIALLGRIFKWFETPPASYGIEINPSTALLIGKPGSVLTQTLQLNSTGVLTDQINLNIKDGLWPIDIELPDGRHIQEDTSFSLGACQGATITATVTIPSGQPRDAQTAFHLSFSNQSDPNLTETVTLTAKTHAPVLVVEHQIWYENIQPYTQTLDSLGLPYDVFHTQSTMDTPSIGLLNHYPIVVWTTGYNWYSPLGTNDEMKLSQYLDGGGRLLLSSQDLLDVNGLSGFIQDRLGVIGFTLSVTPTEVSGALHQPFRNDLGVWKLSFPYTDWGDGLKPSTDSFVILEDQNPYPVGIAHQGANWRTNFYAFPLETLNNTAHHILLSQALLWISPFGESRLDAPPAAASGGQIPITLTLQLANDQPMSGIKAELPLLPETSLIPDSLEGPWGFDPLSNSLVWNGDLIPGEKIVLRAGLQLAENLPARMILPLKARLYDNQGILVVAEAPVQIGVPWIKLDGDYNSKEAKIGDTVAYTVTLRNAGVLADTTTLTLTFPTGISLITDTLTATQGSFTIRQTDLQWSEEIQPQNSVIFHFSGIVQPLHPGIRLATSVKASDLLSEKKIWFVVNVPAYYYLPIMKK